MGRPRGEWAQKGACAFSLHGAANPLLLKSTLKPQQSPGFPDPHLFWVIHKHHIKQMLWRSEQRRVSSLYSLVLWSWVSSLIKRSSKPQFNNHQDFLAACLSSHLPPERMLKASISCPRPDQEGEGTKSWLFFRQTRMFVGWRCVWFRVSESEGKGWGERPHCPLLLTHLSTFAPSADPKPRVQITTIRGICLLLSAAVLCLLCDPFSSLPLTHILFSATPAGPNLLTHLSQLLGKCSL